MLMTGTAMKCGANRTLKEWVRQVQFEFVHNVRVRSKELSPRIAVADKIGKTLRELNGQDAFHQ